MDDEDYRTPPEPPGEPSRLPLERVRREWDELWKRHTGPKSNLSPDEQRLLWAHTARLLAVLADGLRERSRRQGRPWSRDAEVARLAAIGMSGALQGFPPNAWRSGPPRGPSEDPKGQRTSTMRRVGIRYAAAYLRAVEEGHVKDPKRTKTVCDLYGVGRRAVNGWAMLDPGDHYERLLESLPVESGPSQDLDQLRQERAKDWLEEGAKLYIQRVL